MPNWTRLAVGWAVAATVALAFSWGAVAQVRNRVIQPTVEIPTTAAAATQPPDATTTSSPEVIRVEPEIVETTTTTTSLEVDPTAGSSPTTSSSTQPPPTSTSPPSTTTTTQPPQTTTTAPPATTTTAAPQTVTSTYTLDGGVVTISYSPGVVNLVSAIPQPGYSTDPRETGPTKVRIRFESEEHTSDFRAEWEGGELRITQNESGDS